MNIKYSIVSADERETGERKLLNFGHTLGHAIENIYHLPHGHAVSIGMAAAASISQQVNALPERDKERVIKLMERYGLPVYFEYDNERVWEVLILDKKKTGDSLNFILLNRIGDGVVKSIPLVTLKALFDAL